MKVYVVKCSFEYEVEATDEKAAIEEAQRELMDYPPETYECDFEVNEKEEEDGTVA